MFLTTDELRELTGLMQYAAQVRWLQRNGLLHYVRADGRPVVPRAAIAKGPQEEMHPLPDFDALRQK